ncbi:SusC/RagA family TonB-linked outer membrane protein [Chitinophaga sp. MM2321]|uniref:SusC/RagA family TonB-linked outer membrane protein n=1 Tax=Chitinophaga sp. MM2321 TaxID=3137178 RepID=UPI0032D574D4
MNNTIHTDAAAFSFFNRKMPVLTQRQIQFIIAMKMFLILLAISLRVSAAAYSQEITLSLEKAPLRDVMKSIRQQTGYQFLFKSSYLKEAKPVTIDLQKESVKDVLEKIFSEQPFSYTIENKVIIIQPKIDKKKDDKFTPESILDEEKQIIIKGKVINEKNEPLIGVNVRVKNGTVGTTTNQNGEYSITAGPDETLVFSYIGYLTLEKNINQQNELNIILIQKDNQLDQVQIIGYGTTTRRLSTGNIGTITSKEIQDQPVGNPLLAMQGRIPGVFINQNSGLPGGGITVRVQGLNSIGQGNDPLYIIDGVPYNSQRLPNLASQLGNSGGVAAPGQDIPSGNPLSYLNPGDIESIDVLKDADATAIYGSRAANGAILITTKRGKPGKTIFDFTTQQGYGKVASKLNLMNRQQYLEMRKEAYKNDDLPIPTSETIPDPSNYDLTVWDTTRNTNWQKELIGGTAKYSNYQLAISGGNEQTTFRISGTYNRQTTVFQNDLNDSKAAIGFNLNHTTNDQRFRTQFSINYLNDDNRLPAIDQTRTAIIIPPIAPKIFNEDGSLNWQRIASGTDSVSTWANPLSMIQSRYKNKTNNLTGNLLMSYKVLEGLEIKGSFGYNFANNKEVVTYPLTINAPELQSISQRYANYGYGNMSSWIFEPQITYNKELKKSKIDLLVGGTLRKDMTDNLLLQGSGYISDLVLEDIRSASSLNTNSTINSIYKYIGIFGRINYNYDEKYIINLSGRRDGTSRFGSNNKFHNFGSIGVAWLFSNENFIKEMLSFISYGKLRASIGTTGNDQIGDYQYMSLLNSPIGISMPYFGQRALIPNGHPNPSLAWELTKKIQLGIDIGFNNDHLIVGLTYLRNRSSNQLLSYQLPMTTGYPYVLRNFPATIENNGWEISINSTNLATNKFKWTSSFNVTIPKNKLIEFKNLETSVYSNTLIVGEPIGTVPAFKFAGVDQETGLYQFYDSKGTVTTSPSYITDRIYFYNPNPTLYGGVQNEFQFNNISIDFLFQFVKQDGQNYLTGNYPGAFYSDPTTTYGNQPTYVLDRWQVSKVNTVIQKYTTTQPVSDLYAQSSSLSFSNASYIRLKNVSISWQLLKQMKIKSVLRNSRIFLQGQNLITITNYNGLDPESRSIANLPPLKVYTMGIQLIL